MNNKTLKEGLTYDDVLVVPSYSEVLPNMVNTSTRFTKNIKLNIPIVSAAMDTVTESKMAIAIAQEGGIGVLHKNMSIDAQALEVRRVKRSESGMILDPVSISPNKTLKDALDIMTRYKISGAPVGQRDRLGAILTNRDIRFATNLELKVSDRMTSKNLVTVPIKTSLNMAKKKLH